MESGDRIAGRSDNCQSAAFTATCFAPGGLPGGVLASDLVDQCCCLSRLVGVDNGRVADSGNGRDGSGQRTNDRDALLLLSYLPHLLPGIFRELAGLSSAPALAGRAGLLLDSARQPELRQAGIVCDPAGYGIDRSAGPVDCAHPAHQSDLPMDARGVAYGSALVGGYYQALYAGSQYFDGGDAHREQLIAGICANVVWQKLL